MCLEHIPGIYHIGSIQDAGSMGLLLVRSHQSSLYRSTTKNDKIGKLKKTKKVFAVFYRPTSSSHGNLTEFSYALFGLKSEPDKGMFDYLHNFFLNHFISNFPFDLERTPREVDSFS